VDCGNNSLFFSAQQNLSCSASFSKEKKKTKKSFE
jgi:hypothetical protein